MQNFVEDAFMLAPGPTARGSLCTLDGIAKTQGDRILLIERLLLEHYAAVRKVRGVICEDGGSSDHASIMCRTIGVPLMRIPGACSIFHPGGAVTLHPANRMVYRGLRRFHSDLAPHAQLPDDLARSAQVHLAVFGETEVRSTNAVAGPLPVAGFYLSAERIWMGDGVANPFAYLEQRGIGAVTNLLKSKLRACLIEMHPRQLLNFRSLDMRTGEFPVGGSNVERNPDLGLHGIRRLLRQPDLLRAELDAVAELRAEGFSGLVFSLPFINDCDELDQVLDIARQRGIADPPLGVFIETAAAIFELPMFLERGVRHVFIGSRDLTQMILAL